MFDTISKGNIARCCKCGMWWQASHYISESEQYFCPICKKSVDTRHTEPKYVEECPDMVETWAR